MSDEKNAIIQLAVPQERRGLRVDRFIALQVENLSRQRVKSLIDAGKVVVDDAVCHDGGHKLRGGEVVFVEVPPAEPIDVRAEAIPLAVEFEDDELIVIDKPAGLVTHPAPGHESGTLVNALIAHAGSSLSGIGGVKRPGIVHRLDKDTSGLLVIAKTDRAHRGLSEQFSAHGRDGRLERKYTAFVWGVLERRSGRIEAALGRSPTNRRKVAVVADDRGRAAATNYELLESFQRDGAVVVSAVQLSLETGRTHQIRVHMASIGHPILGDSLYGAGFKASVTRLGPAARTALAQLQRQALHAAVLGFEHPVTGEAMRFESRLPDDMAALHAALRADDESQSAP